MFKTDTQEGRQADEEKGARRKTGRAVAQQKTVKKTEDIQKEARKTSGTRKPVRKSSISYLQVPGPEAQHYKLQTSCLGVLARRKESSGSWTSSWDPQEDHVYLVGKDKGVKGAVCTRTDYPLYGKSCQAAASGAVHDCALAVPPVLGANGREDNGTGLKLSYSQGITAATTADTPGGIQVFSWGNTGCREGPEGFEKVT